MISIKESKNIKIENSIKDFLNPDFVYIPIEIGYELMVKTNAKINKEDILLKSNDKIIYSPISGKVLGKGDMMVNNEMTSCIVIQNDFKEHVKKRIGAVKYINEYSKDDIYELINKYNAYDLKKKNYKYFLINGIDTDPFEKTNSLLININSSKILETIDALTTILEIENTIFTLNNNDTDNVINLTNNIGTYPNIHLKLIPDLYPIGFKNILLKNIFNSKVKMDEVLYLDVMDVYNIYNVLKRNKPITEKLITLSGNAIKNPQVLNIKIGTSISDIVKNCANLEDIKYQVTINGLLAGKTLNSMNTAVDFNTKSIFLNTVDREKAKACINCGLCNQQCPVGLNPKYIMEHKNADKSKCIKCGLCTYICPSKINFKDYLGGKK